MAASIKSRGIYCPGFRLAFDSIVNLSLELIRQFVLLFISHFHHRLCPVYINFCTEPAPSNHILPILLETDDVIAVDNWQGPEIFIGEDSTVKTQKKIAIIGDLNLDNQKDIGTFLDLKAVQQVPRKGGWGLFMTTNTRSLTDGKRVHREWQKYF